MGLDVYLYRCEDRKKAKAAEEKYDKQSEANWHEGGKEYNDIPEARRKEISEQNKATAVALGCSEYGEHLSCEKIEQPSTLYPEHYFKIGYFRSSYNGSGFDSVMRNQELATLYDIFDHDKEEYEFTPDWKEALKNTKKAIEKFQKALDDPLGNVRVFHVAKNMFSKDHAYPTSEKEALAVARKKLGNDKKSPFGDDGFSSIEGDFFPGGMDVIALVPGTYKIFGEMECTYVVYRQKKEEGKDWYLQALEIVQETIEFVLKQDDPQNYYFHWSG